MLIDLRHHIITIVSIFLALAVGMVVGSSYLTGTSIEGHVSALLNKEFTKLRADNEMKQATIDGLTQQVAKQTEFDRGIAPILVKGRLINRRIAIIQTGDYSEATQSSKAILEMAGAEVSSITTIESPKWASIEDASGILKSISGEMNANDPVGRILETLAYDVVSGSNGHALDVLEDDGLLSKAGQYDKHVSGVVFVGGSKGKDISMVQKIDYGLIDKFKTFTGVTVVGVEPGYAETSYISAYHGKDLSTVNNVDEPMGQVGLVFAIGGETGSFGTKEYSDKVVPETLENGDWRIESRQ